MKKNKNFSTDIDRVLCGTYPKGEMVYVCDTPELLQAVGLKNLPILMTQKHIISCMQSPSSDESNSHGLEKNYMASLPSFIQNPAIILNSTTKLNSIVCVSNEFDYANRPNIIAILNSGNGVYNAQKIDTNILLSTYGRNNFDSFLNSCISSDDVIFFDKENSHELLKTARVQFPRGLAIHDYNTIIHDISKKVNGFPQKIFLESSRIFHTEENELGLKSLKSGEIARHVLGENRLDYIIDSQFVRHEDTSDNASDIRKKVALHNTTPLQEIIHNPGYPSEYKENALNGKLFSNDGYDYEIVCYCTKDSKAIIKSQQSEEARFYAVNGLGAKSDSQSLRWNSSTYFGENIRQAMQEYSAINSSEKERG